jgi:hypothetical protein
VVTDETEFLREEECVEPLRLAVVLFRQLAKPEGRTDEEDPRASDDFARFRIDAVSLMSGFRCAHAQSCRNTLI